MTSRVPPAEDRSKRLEGPSAGPSGRRKLWQAGIPYVFLLPFMLLFLVFLVLPLVYALGISVFETRLVGGNVFVGLENYARAFGDANFWEGVRRMIVFGIFQVPIMLGLALAFALVLDSGTIWLRSLFRLGFYLPYAVPSVVAALIWGYLYGPSFGPFTQLAELLNIPAPNFLSDRLMLASIANIVTWEFTGYNMIIMYAALQSLPAELDDAGAVDGAKGWQIALYIKVPMIRSAIFLTVIFSIIGTLQLFNEPQVMYAIAPQVIRDHYTPNLYAYTLAFTNQEYNYSAAISFVLGAVVVVFSYTFMLLTNRGELSSR
ncbi:MAG: sugar ABC transporter permease [Actinomycetota bacterium]|nr:sugar ABC transporter permease [Actinomycetota bacterium]